MQTARTEYTVQLAIWPTLFTSALLASDQVTTLAVHKETDLCIVTGCLVSKLWRKVEKNKKR